MKAIIGKKVGMTQIFDEKGVVIPVTVVQAGPCVVAQVKTVETDGYNAIQVGYGEIKDKHINKPEAGHFAKAGIENKKHLREFRGDTIDVQVGDEEKVDVRLYRVIYNAIEDITAAMKGMLDPVYEEKVLGHAEIRQLFKASGVGNIAGSYVLDGKFERNCQARITRDGIVIFEGELESLKRFKDDVKEVAAGYECGLVFKKFNDIKVGDFVEAFKMVEVPR